MRKYFGTDGIRGLVGKFPITAEFAQKLGNAVGQIIDEYKEHNLVIVGQDTRGSSDFIKYALVSGLTAAGVDVIDLGVVPTPIVAFMAVEKQAGAGFVVTASHNKFTDNGIKLFSSKGFKLRDEIELEVEEKIDGPFFYNKDCKFGTYTKLENPLNDYIKDCKAKFLNLIKYNGKVVVDCANGAGSNNLEKLLAEFNINTITIASKPNGLNINEKCGATYIKNISEAVLKNKADLGIALDGDGDRIIIVDEKGQEIDGDAILYILSNYTKVSGSTAGVVGTAMTNMSYENEYKKQNIPFIRAKVGDRYVIEELVKNNYKLGGESSGHIINLNYGTTGDGLLTALQLLAILSLENKAVSELYSGVELMQQTMINVPLKSKVGADELSTLIEDVSTVEKRLGDNGRVLLRPSGTEPVLRVMVEATDKETATKEAEFLVEKVKSKLAV
ncbi:phosphoglucosamine mutase [Francisella frigiditurris]|uniref:Phosphoglucosamine mutase n=1 Tax=Francisella frigiditurris TaxID=1542390 RepID=A0A1J0KUH3_9GAMM|nr:phosphoglucosamine mutase [Francisella frigiditurris]APC97448.1 phosphoglucosamine mutase [Francisella frigiditurris]